MNSYLLRAEGVAKSFPKEGGAVRVLGGVSLRVAAGESVVIVGQSGSGKSTLLSVLGSLMRASEGKLFFDGKDVETFSEAEITGFRNARLGFVFQFHHLLPDFTAAENAAMPLRMRGVPRDEALARARAWLGKVGLAHRESHPPYALSGGEQQRVAIARALVGGPSVVLADEPTGNLDHATAAEVSDLLFGLAKSHRMSLVVATHNPEVMGMADRVYRLTDGLLEVA